MSAEALQKIDYHEEDDKRIHTAFEKRLENLEKDVGVLKSDMGACVPWAWFLTTMVAVGAAQITVWIYMANAIKQVQSDAQETKNTVYQINGKLEPFDFIIEPSKD